MNNEKTLSRLGAVLVVLGALSLSACGSSTVFVSSWRSPKAEPLQMRGEKVAAVVMMKNELTRRHAEDVLAREITHYGATGVAMYTLMAEAPEGNEKLARAAIERAGIKGIVVMRPMGTKTRTETHEYYNDPYYNGYWGGYYGYGWNSAYVDYGSTRGALVGAAPIYYGPSHGTTETYTTTEEVVSVEVLVFSLKQNLLVWGGTSETSDPGTKVEDFVVHLAAMTVKELGGQGLLSSN